MYNGVVFCILNIMFKIVELPILCQDFLQASSKNNKKLNL